MPGLVDYTLLHVLHNFIAHKTILKLSDLENRLVVYRRINPVDAMPINAPSHPALVDTQLATNNVNSDHSNTHTASPLTFAGLSECLAAFQYCTMLEIRHPSGTRRNET